MGIIIKQSLKGSIWSYLGLVVGYISVGILMPNFFQPDQIGLVQLFVALAAIFTNFSTLGFGSVIYRMFPEFRNKLKNHNGFLFLTLSTGLLGFCLSVIAFFILKPNIIESNIQKSPLLVEYIILLIPLFFFRILFNLLDTFNRVLYDAVTGAFWNEFVHKAINLCLILLFAFHLVNFRQFFFGYIVSMSLPAFPLIFILLKRGEFSLRPNFGFLNRPLIREMIIVAGYGLINGLSGILTNNIDKILVNHFLSLEQVGIFSVCALFATVIMIPSRATVNISTGILAQAWKNNNISHIQEIYSKASLNQTIMGALIFIGIIVNLDNIFTILPEAYLQGKWVLIIYSLGVFVMITATTSGTILLTSSYYKVLSLIIIIQIIVTISLHLIFIPIFGIKGAAIAVFFTYLFRTIAIVGFIKIKMRLFCYQYKHLLVLAFAFISLAAGYFMPDTGLLIPDILIKSVTVVVIYISLILGLKISEDMNHLFFTIRKTTSEFLKRNNH